MRSLVFVPLDAARLRRLRAQGLTDVTAHATTPALFEALDYGPELAEDAEFAALTYASVASLTAGPRLVAVAETECEPLPDPDGFGAVRVQSLAWSAVTALFIDEPAAAPLARAARVAVTGVSLSAAWELDAVQDLLASCDLLWHDAAEVDEVLERMG